MGEQEAEEEAEWRWYTSCSRCARLLPRHHVDACMHVDGGGRSTGHAGMMLQGCKVARAHSHVPV